MVFKHPAFQCDMNGEGFCCCGFGNLSPQPLGDSLCIVLLTSCSPATKETLRSSETWRAGRLGFLIPCLDLCPAGTGPHGLH